MIIDCISDLHGHYPELEGGDLLIVAGDLTQKDTIDGYIKWKDWIIKEGEKYYKIVIIAGNHDNMIHQKSNGFDLYFCKENQSKWVYLEDSGTEFEYWETPNPPMRNCELRKLKIYGSPWSKTFEGMNPKCKAFTVDTEEELAAKFSSIPHDVDILITHSPPWTILDRTIKGEQVGSTYLMGALFYCFRPKLWVFGHVHESYGKEIFKGSTICVNASHVNERYQPVNPPIRIIL